MKTSKTRIIRAAMQRSKPLVLIAATLALLFAPQVSGLPAAAAGGPCSLGIAGIAPMPDAKTYFVELSSTDGAPTDAHLQLFSDGAEYAVTLTGLTFTRITPAEATALKSSARFVSAPAYFALPKLDFLTAARATPIDSATQTPKQCTARFGYTDYYMRQAISGFEPTAAWAAWRQQHVDAFHGLTATAATLVSESPVTCDHPNNAANLVQRFDPMYPRLARQQGISGTTIVNVDIDENGNVTNAYVQTSSGDNSLDIASVDAARRSKYSPATFRCLPLPATFSFVETFGAPTNNTGGATGIPQ
jgi:TonB family protein